MIRHEIWASQLAADGTWLSLGDDGTFWRNRTLPPAVGAAGEVGVRMPRTDGIGVKLSSSELKALVVAATRAWVLADEREAVSE